RCCCRGRQHSVRQIRTLPAESEDACPNDLLTSSGRKQSPQEPGLLRSIIDSILSSTGFVQFQQTSQNPNERCSMKTKMCSWIRCLVILPAAALLLAGCGQKEEPAAPSAQNQKSSETAASLQKAATEMKDKVQQTAQDVAQKAGAEADKLKAQAQEQ